MGLEADRVALFVPVTWKPRINDQYLKQRRRGWYCRVPVPAYAIRDLLAEAVTPEIAITTITGAYR